MKKKSDTQYNERLFSGGIRQYLHSARFKWLAKSLLRLECNCHSVLELGCYDGKSINYLPIKPNRYLGLDANWEKGLDIAKDHWKNETNYIFKQCASPDEMGISGEKYDISICMETFEHIPPDLVTPYIEQLAKVTKSYLFVTVPNEIGIVFFFKYFVKLLWGDVEKYTLAEVMYETLGRTDKVRRGEHKGFNYNNLIATISDHFEIIEVSGHPLTLSPISLNFGIGIIGRTK